MEVVRDEDEGEMGRYQASGQELVLADQDQPEDAVVAALQLASIDDKIKIDIQDDQAEDKAQYKAKTRAWGALVPIIRKKSDAGAENVEDQDAKQRFR